MGFKYAIKNEGLYYVTFTVVDWIDVFTRRIYKDIVVDSLKHCQRDKGLVVYAWCLMSNHIHLIASSSDRHSLSDIFRALKKFTSKEIVSAIAETNESRTAWLLDKFEFRGRINPKLKTTNSGNPGFIPLNW